jgi:hypothetical protein
LKSHCRTYVALFIEWLKILIEANDWLIYGTCLQAAATSLIQGLHHDVRIEWISIGQIPKDCLTTASPPMLSKETGQTPAILRSGKQLRKSG